MHSLATCRSVRRRKGCKMDVLTQEPRGRPHPGTEGVSSPRSRGVSSPRSREGVLTQEQRGCPHPGAKRVSSPRSREGVLTRISRGCPHPKVYWVSSPRSACRKFDLLRSKSCQGIFWRHQMKKWWSSTSP